MRITNASNLPAPLIAAVSQTRKPVPDRITVTVLIGPPQIRLLMMRHWEELEEDAADRLWAAMGSMMHKLLESHAAIEGHQAERTLETIVEGITVAGTFDLYHEDGVISDYKFTSVWATLDGIKGEWVTQLNLYAELLRRAGERVERLQIVVIYRDWSKGKANDPSYPQSQVRIFQIPLWSSEQASAFLVERVRLHVAALAGEITECSDEERWARPTKHALMKRGRKTAIKLYDIADEAHLAVTSADLYVEVRPGANVRCESYCSVAAFCPQFARLKEEAEKRLGYGNAEKLTDGAAS